MRVNATKLLVSDIQDESKETKSGIILPNAVMKKDCLKGKVLLTGEGTADMPMVYKENETVLFHPRAGSKFNYEDKEYRLIDITDVFLGGI